MPTAEDIAWFKGQFASQIVPLLAGTPFNVDDVTAIACQETGYLWSSLRRRGLSVARVLELCVGDTIDKNRKAFPVDRAALEAAPRGAEMFAIARQALLDMGEATQNSDYLAAAMKPDKFCHSFGIFQSDIQFFETDPDYFLERRYTRFDQSFGKCVEELKRGAKKLGFSGRASLTDMEMAAVAIAYNTGRYNPAKRLRQGWFDGKRYYGENYFNYLRLAHSVPTLGGAPATLMPAAPGEAVLPPPTPITDAGAPYVVDTVTNNLNLRRTPEVDSKAPHANLVGTLPDGHPVRVTAGSATGGFLPIEATVNGALLRGWASAKFLKPAGGAPTAHAPLPGAGPFPPVFLPRRPGSVTRRTEAANAASLNEPGQPVRGGATPEILRDEIDSIVTWLAVDDPTHRRYQPGAGRTYCNIYAYDFCTLAGPYLPRVWWNARAVAVLARGGRVEPRYGDTIDEQRANDLFRWLRDFGESFGWRRTGTLDGLQQSANAGGIGLIVARRRDDGRSGHIVVVVPERGDHAAIRDRAGAVVAPLQSQAGSSNFQYSTSKREWWLGEQFAEFAFWIHA